MLNAPFLLASIIIFAGADNAAPALSIFPMHALFLPMRFNHSMRVSLRPSNVVLASTLCFAVGMTLYFWWSLRTNHSCIMTFGLHGPMK